VIHFAGYKAVGESVKLPLKYYRNNVQGTLNLGRDDGEARLQKGAPHSLLYLTCTAHLSHFVSKPHLLLGLTSTC